MGEGLDPEGAYDRLIDLLDSNDASYRIIDHEPEGRTEMVSPMRGNDLASAAKCMVVMIKTTRKHKTYVLAVLPGDRQVDFAALRQWKDARYVGFPKPEIAEQLSGCAIGTVLPFSWHDDLQLVADPAIYEHDEIYFNAGRLDRSLALKSADHRRIANATELAMSV